jgi:hypothetical protein
VSLESAETNRFLTMRSLKAYILIGAATESVVFALLLLAENEPKAAPWLNALQSPAGPVILRLARLPAVRHFLTKFPPRAAVCGLQLLGGLIQTVVFAFLAFCLVHIYGVLRKRGWFSRRTADMT